MGRRWGSWAPAPRHSSCRHKTRTTPIGGDDGEHVISPNDDELRGKMWLAAGARQRAGRLRRHGWRPGAADKTAWPTKADVVAAHTAFTAEGIAALDARMKEAVDKAKSPASNTRSSRTARSSPSTSSAISRVGGPPMTEDTIFRIRSMTKPITGVAMMQLWEQGKWKPEDPVTKFLPGARHLKVATKQDSITEGVVPANRPPNMNEVMTHTAGFGYGLSAASASTANSSATTRTPSPTCRRR